MLEEVQSFWKVKKMMILVGMKNRSLLEKLIHWYHSFRVDASIHAK